MCWTRRGSRVRPTACPRWGGAGGRAARGQATLEYLLVLLAFLSMAAACACVWHAGREGALLRQAVRASSHRWGGGDALGSVQDLSLY